MPNTTPIEQAILDALEDGRAKTLGEIRDATQAESYLVLAEPLRQLKQQKLLRAQFSQEGPLVYQKNSPPPPPPSPLAGLLPWRPQQ